MTGPELHRTLVIAEAGVNHNGDPALAIELVARAKDAGADAVKFQTFRADCTASGHAPKADYQTRSTSRDVSQQEMLRALELDEAAHRSLARQCQDVGIEFMSTAFDVPSLRMLRAMGLVRYKVPSGEITNLPLLREVAACGAPVLLSTGMASLGDVEAAIEALESAGLSRSLMTVLQCTSEYPAPFDDVNLRAMTTLGDAFGVRFGLSDHTMGIEVAIAAVALGACVIEKHFTIDRQLPGPDHQASLEPHELKAMVQSIRNVEKALGNGVKRLAPSEARNREVVRKSIVAACDIAPGEVFTESNLTTKRPGGGVSPMRWDDVLGRRAPRPFAADEQIAL